MTHFQETGNRQSPKSEVDKEFSWARFITGRNFRLCKSETSANIKGQILRLTNLRQEFCFYLQVGRLKFGCPHEIRKNVHLNFKSFDFQIHLHFILLNVYRKILITIF